MMKMKIMITMNSDDDVVDDADDDDDVNVSCSKFGLFILLQQLLVFM